METPLAQMCPQGRHKAAAPAFSTFQPMDKTRRSCQGLGLFRDPRLQNLRGGEARPPAVHTLGTARALGPASVPGSPEKVEEVPGEGSLSLQAKTRAWFQKTQAWSLLQCGGAPAWFHGFITRRSQACCRHFLLGQLTDGRHVVLGEDSAHARLQDLLCHYTARPLSPYGETLSQPLARQTPEPVGLSPRTKDSDSPSQSQDPSPLHKQSLSPAWEPKEAPLPRPKPPIPAKPMLPTEVCTSPEPRLRPAPPPIYQDPEESIAFYAMGRGCPAEASSHVYAELPGLELPLPLRPQVGLRRGRGCDPGLFSSLQSPGSLQLRPENSVPQQPPLCWRHTLPANLSRQVLQDRRQGLSSSALRSSQQLLPNPDLQSEQKAQLRPANPAPSATLTLAALRVSLLPPPAAPAPFELSKPMQRSG
ncbi:SH2 domain-containing protein 2A [Heterocephalus glaber]|uniref:SH2 domain-containing protein 2A n=1 Tax=Heterocephalus glaber TaxID=10181 RepID=G5BLQ1_HETGA|nr:SH2 domain-containing protein 2A [Heterocephalus glaber]